jgi:antitoxin HicB
VAGGPEGNERGAGRRPCRLRARRKELPRPSKAKRGQYLVPVAPLVAAKLALRAAMQEEGVSNVALASRLGLSEAAVRRLVDPDHASRLDGIVAALSVLGRGLIIEDQKQVAA